MLKQINYSTVNLYNDNIVLPNGTLVINNANQLRLHDGTAAGGNPVGGGNGYELTSGTYAVSLSGDTGILTLSTASTILGAGLDPNVYIETFTTSTTSIWTFGTNGVLTLPELNPIIKGSGTGTDVTVVATTGSNTSTWVFSADGKLMFPNKGQITMPTYGPYAIIDGNLDTPTLGTGVLYVASPLPLDTLLQVGDLVTDSNNLQTNIVSPGVTSNNDGTYNIYVYNSYVSVAQGSLTFGNNPVWQFKNGGTLALPNGSSIDAGVDGQGIGLITDRGTIRFGNRPELIGGPSHYHIMRDPNADIDLYFGDDYNYLLQPTGGGITIGSNIRSGTGTQYTWMYGIDGILTVPGTIWARASDNGSIVFSSDGTTDHGSIKVDGGHNMITSAASNYYVKRAGQDRFAITDTDTTLMAGANLVLKSNKSSAEKVWTFGTNGDLTLPNSTVIGDIIGSVTHVAVCTVTTGDGYNGFFSGFDFGALPQIDGTWTVNGPGVTNGVIDGLDYYLHLVQLLVSGGQQFQSGGTYTFSSMPVYSIGSKISVTGITSTSTWDFYTNGALKFPDSTVQTTAWTGKLTNNGHDVTLASNGALSLPGNITINANVETNASASVGSLAGAPATIWTASTSSVIGAQIVCRSNVNYGQYVEMLTANIVQDINGNVNVLVTGQVGSTSTGYGPTTITAGINSGTLYAVAQPAGSNDSNFVVSVTEFY